MVSRTDTFSDRPIVTFGLGDVFSLCYKVHFDVEIIEDVFEENAEFVISTNTFNEIVCFIVGA